MRKTAVSQIVTVFFFFSFLFLAPSHSMAAKEVSASDSGGQPQNEELDIGNMIMEHVTDSYEWHLFTLGKHPVSISLPVILYDQGHWILFSSSKLKHGSASYKGYHIAESGVNVGKLVRLDANGKEVLPKFDISITKTVLAIFINAFLVILIFKLCEV